MQRSKADLVNISSTGFMADSAIRIAQGDRVWATFPGMEPKAAIVIWSREFEIGCEFIDPISDYAFDALLRKLQETGE